MVLARLWKVAAGVDGALMKPWWADWVEERAPTYVNRLGTPQVVGRLHMIHSTSLKATCRVGHRACSCWVNMGKITGDTEHVRHELMTWLAKGLTPSAAEHKHASQDLKRALGMRVR